MLKPKREPTDAELLASAERAARRAESERARARRIADVDAESARVNRELGKRTA